MKKYIWFLLLTLSLSLVSLLIIILSYDPEAVGIEIKLLFVASILLSSFSIGGLASSLVSRNIFSVILRGILAMIVMTVVIFTSLRDSFGFIRGVGGLVFFAIILDIIISKIIKSQTDIEDFS